MNGTGYILTGILLMVISTGGTILLECFLGKKKKRIREKTYQIYD